MKALRKTAVLLVLGMLVTVLPGEDIRVNAKPANDKVNQLQQEIQQNQQEINEITGQLEENQDNLDDLKDEQSVLKGELSNLKDQLTTVSDNLADLEQQIREKEAEIAVTQANLEEAKATESWQYSCMVIRVRDMYERNDTSYLNALIASDSFGELLNTADFFEKVAAYDQKKFREFQENRKLIEEQEARLQQEKIELDNLKVAAEAEKNKVSGLISQTSNNISEYAAEIAEAEERARAYEAELRAKEETLEKLQQELALSLAAAQGTWRDISEVKFAEGDRYLLANLIYCEAGGEPYEGQVAVGSVVINRVLSAKFPDTVVGVIYQKRQFSPVGSGRLELALSVNKATASCYRAADEAMSGKTNVGNCVFFRTPIPGLTGINIGGHVFY